MTVIPIADAKARFSEIIRQVEAGETVMISRGVAREEVAAIVPISDFQRGQRPIALGLASDWQVTMSDDWALTDEELLTSGDMV